MRQRLAEPGGIIWGVVLWMGCGEEDYNRRIAVRISVLNIETGVNPMSPGRQL